MPRFFLVLFLLLFGCTSATVNLPASLPLEALSLEGGQTVHIKIPPDPQAGPVEAAPVMYLTVQLLDAGGAPVLGSVWMDGALAAGDASEATVALQGVNTRGVPVKVTAPGYASWEIGLRMNLKHSRHFVLPVKLMKVD